MDTTSRSLHSEFVLLFLQFHREQFKSKVDNILTKVVTLRINLNIDGVPMISRSYTHPSHSQTSRLLTSSISIGVPVPHTTQCIRDV